MDEELCMPSAAFELGNRYADGSHGVVQDNRMATVLFAWAAAEGHSGAQSMTVIDPMKMTPEENNLYQRLVDERNRTSI